MLRGVLRARSSGSASALLEELVHNSSTIDKNIDVALAFSLLIRLRVLSSNLVKFLYTIPHGNHDKSAHEC